MSCSWSPATAALSLRAAPWHRLRSITSRTGQKVKEHSFENMIVLCANCHGLKGEKPRRVGGKRVARWAS